MLTPYTYQGPRLAAPCPWPLDPQGRRACSARDGPCLLLLTLLLLLFLLHSPPLLLLLQVSAVNQPGPARQGNKGNQDS